MDVLKDLSPGSQKDKLASLSRSQLQKLAKEAGVKVIRLSSLQQVAAQLLWIASTWASQPHICEDKTQPVASSYNGLCFRHQANVKSVEIVESLLKALSTEEDPQTDAQEAVQTDFERQEETTAANKPEKPHKNTADGSSIAQSPGGGTPSTIKSNAKASMDINISVSNIAVSAFSLSLGATSPATHS